MTYEFTETEILADIWSKESGCYAANLPIDIAKLETVCDFYDGTELKYWFSKWHTEFDDLAQYGMTFSHTHRVYQIFVKHPGKYIIRYQRKEANQ
jgi:hypothetical protein